MRKLIIKSIVICLIAAIFSGCSPEETPSEMPAPTKPLETSEEKSPVPTAGGEITFSMRNPITLNPILNEDASVDKILRLVFEPVGILDETQKPIPNPALINSFDFASDGMSVQINIKSGAIWSDETPIDADDLIFTLDTMKDASENSIHSHFMKNVAGYEKVSESAVKISFLNLYGQNGYFLSFPIIPAHYYKGAADPKSEINMTPLGNGSYKFLKLDQMESLTLLRSTNSLKESPYIEQIKVLFTPDYDAELNAFNQGIIDVLSSDAVKWSVFQGARNVNSYEYVSSSFDFIGFNNEKPLFDTMVRQAIAMSLPDDLVEQVYLDHAIKAETPISPQSWLYDGNNEAFAHDIEKAKASIGSPFRTTILVNAENAERIRIANILKSSLNDIGIGTEIKAVEFNLFEQMITDGDFDIFVGGLNLSANPDLSFLLHSAGNDGSGNILRYSNEKIDNLLLLAYTSCGDLNMKLAFSNLQKYIADELPLISVAFRKSAVLTDSSIYGVTPRINDIYSNITEWYRY